eukprot:CAMPEP_0170465332 /NCGR_PEP_ID=MMETSP0123-20130129/9713_1 /TAXON_ID=182087 /ORGANISM="Favella ehrenbergii, Strain Fehren 1" /LENGTH=76 /DNA_ID=CAMNT_0010731197 /DNA_START=22 /DNA_END=252 /DNA_ORIENTATION=+
MVAMKVFLVALIASVSAGVPLEHSLEPVTSPSGVDYGKFVYDLANAPHAEESDAVPAAEEAQQAVAKTTAAASAMT